MRSYIALTAALCFIVLSATEIKAQGRPTPLDRRVEEAEKQRNQYERETLEGKRGGKSKNPADQKRAQAIAAQVQQDFERIQTIYNDIVLAMSNNKEMDYEFFSAATIEVKKCAGRLKSNLALPQVEDDKNDSKKQDDLGSPEHIEARLMALRSHIVSFVTNPLFESSGVLDIKLSNRASLDLKRIIELCDSISEKLKKDD